MNFLMNFLKAFDNMCGPLCGGSSAYAVDDDNNDANDDVVDSSSKKIVTVAPKVPRGKYASDTKTTTYKCVLFAALPSDAEKEAVIALGFDEESWNESGWPASESKCWGDLTEEERKAIETLGWDSAAWDSTHGSSSFIADLRPFVGNTYKKILLTRQ